MSKFKLIIEFIKNNKVLSLLFLIAFVLIISVMFTKGTLTNQTTENVVSDEYQIFVDNNDYRYFIYNNKYYVFVSDPSKIDKENIRTTLNIPENIDFEVLTPGMGIHESITLTPTN